MKITIPQDRDCAACHRTAEISAAHQPPVEAHSGVRPCHAAETGRPADTHSFVLFDLPYQQRGSLSRRRNAPSATSRVTRRVPPAYCGGAVVDEAGRDSLSVLGAGLLVLARSQRAAQGYRLRLDARAQAPRIAGSGRIACSLLMSVVGPDRGLQTTDGFFVQLPPGGTIASFFGRVPIYRVGPWSPAPTLLSGGWA